MILSGWVRNETIPQKIALSENSIPVTKWRVCVEKLLKKNIFWIKESLLRSIYWLNLNHELTNETSNNDIFGTFINYTMNN